MSQFPIENLNVNQGDSVFENLYITDRFFYDEFKVHLCYYI